MSARPVTVPRIRSLLAGLLASWGSSAGTQAQCQYEVTAVIAAPRCPPPFNNVPATIGTALTEGPDPALVGFYCPCGAGTADTAFVWRASTGLVSLPRPAGVSSMQAADISESGVIVGSYTVSGVGFRGFVYENGEYTELPPLPGGAWSGASAINDAGKVVGFRSIRDGVNPFNAFIWSVPAGFNDLGVINGPSSSALAVNSRGDAVGWTGSSPANSSAFLWQDGVIFDLGFIPGGFTGVGFAVNDLQQVIVSGRLQRDGDTHVRSFLWENGRMTDVGVLPGHDSCAALDVSDIGQVVGFCTIASNPGNPRGFLWQHTMNDLNDLVPPGFTLLIHRAKAVNNSGQVVADGLDLSGDTVTFLLTPVGRPVGDINVDCHVGVADLVILLDHWAQTYSPADLNGDGVVNVLDLIILLLNFGSSS